MSTKLVRFDNSFSFLREKQAEVFVLIAEEEDDEDDGEGGAEGDVGPREGKFRKLEGKSGGLDD